jgi:hypothetical protein
MKNKKIDFLSIAKILLILVILSIYPMSNLYARYTTTDDSSDSAVVARFNVTESFETEQNFPISIKPGQVVERTIIVNNNSDVAIIVTVTMENVTGNLPLQFICEPVEIAPHTDNVKVIIKFKWDSNDSSPEYAEMVDVIKLHLTAKQKD